MSADGEHASETNKDKLDEILNKVNRRNKNVKMVIEMLERIKGANEPKARPMSNAQEGATYENKRKAYLTKLNAGEIKEPKQTTLDYYQVKKEDGVYS